MICNIIVLVNKAVFDIRFLRITNTVFFFLKDIKASFLI